VRFISIAGAVVLAATASAAVAQPHGRSLDRSFGRDGVTLTRFDAGNSVARAVAIGRNKRIVAAGHVDGEFGLARYKPNGRPDHSFSGDGTVSTSFPEGPAKADAVDIGKKGSVVAAGTTCSQPGSCEFAVAKYKPDGHLDRSFGHRGRERIGDPGRLNNFASGVAIDASGRVLIGGTTCTHTNRNDCDFALARLRRNGELDPSFGDGGLVLTPFEQSGIRASAVASSMAIDPQGEIILGGTGCLASLSVDGRCAEGNLQFSLAKYQPNGHLDPGFGDGGEVMDRTGGTNDINAIAADPRGRIVVTGRGGQHQWGLTRFDSDGDLDRTFGDNGKVASGFRNKRTAPVPKGVAIDSSGRIVVAGLLLPAFALTRYQEDGALDRHFGRRGKVVKDFGFGDRSSCNALAIDARDRPVVAGVAGRRFAVARVLG
jgi:uncharacterized delta-60 repeat protein